MSTATLNAIRATTARLFLPAWGIPWAEVSLEEEATLSGAAAFALADLQLAGTIMSGGPGPKGRSAFRVAAGRGGWGRRIAPKAYANDAGVKASTVLADASRECGETIAPETLPKTALGPNWTRDEAPAARVLERVAPSGWYVGEDGVTRIGKRPAVPVGVPVDVISVDKARGVVVLAGESIASLVPGVVVEGIEAVDVLHELTESGYRTTLWGAGIAPTTRRLSALRRLVEQLDPDRRFRGVYEYRVIGQEGERLTLQPIRAALGMPTLERVLVRPGIPGARADVAIGARVGVGFLNAESGRPVVVCFEDAEGDGFRPVELDIDATTLVKLAAGTLAAARQTDAVQAGPFTGVITGPCSLKVLVG